MRHYVGKFLCKLYFTAHTLIQKYYSPSSLLFPFQKQSWAQCMNSCSGPQDRTPTTFLLLRLFYFTARESRDLGRLCTFSLQGCEVGYRQWVTVIPTCSCSSWLLIQESYRDITYLLIAFLILGIPTYISYFIQQHNFTFLSVMFFH